MQLRQSLEKLNQSMHSEQQVSRKLTERDRPVQGGNKEQFEKDSWADEEPSQSIVGEDAEGENEQSVVLGEVEDLKKLSCNIDTCLTSIVNTKALIQEYQKMFEEAIAEMNDESNEIIKRHYN